jgi:hypothetical protein
MPNNRLPFQVVHEQTPQPVASVDEHFPSPRYFQVHFEYLHEYNQLLQTQLAELRLQLDRLNRKLDRMHSATD